MYCFICNNKSVFSCSVCGRPICIEHVRYDVVCVNCIRKRRTANYSIRLSVGKERKVIEELALTFWGEIEVELLGKKFRINEIPAFVALVDDKVVGFLSFYDPSREDCLIVAIGVVPKYQRCGIGRALLKSVENWTKGKAKEKLLVSTSNDDLPALAFYQLNGFQIYEVVPNAIYRKHGKLVKGLCGIPIRDEIRLRKFL